MKSSDMVIGEAYAIGDSYAARRGKLRRAVLIEKQPNGRLLVEGPYSKHAWDDPSPDDKVTRYVTTVHRVNHTWAEEEVFAAKRAEEKTKHDALKVRADAVVASVWFASLGDRKTWHDGSAYSEPTIHVPLDVAEKIVALLDNHGHGA